MRGPFAVKTEPTGTNERKQALRPKQKGFQYFLVACALISLVFLAGALLRGWTYYATPLTGRYRSDIHQQFKPGGSIGHTLGIAGSAMLIGLLSYSLRKRVRFLKRWGSLSRWLQFHIFLGIAGPAFITLHTSFKLRGIVAISYWSMMLVAISGMIGRYLYAQIPHAISGGELKQLDLSSRIEEINTRLADVLQPADLKKIQGITSFTTDSELSGIKALLLMISDDLWWLKRRSAIRRILNSYPALNHEERRQLLALAHERQLQLRKMSLLRVSHNLFRYWHVIHLPLAQTMYITMAIHIYVAIVTGYF